MEDSLSGGVPVAVTGGAAAEVGGVRIGFYGAAGEITGSNFLVDTGSRKYVVDCGLFQGASTITEHNDQPFAYNPAEVDAVILTHAHLDHVGRVPKLVAEGFKGPIFATAATIELAKLVLQDTLDLATHRHERDGSPLLFNRVDLNRTLNLFQAVPYHKRHPLLDGDALTLHDAGHILGSSTVQLEAAGKKIVFSGDIGHAPNILLPQPDNDDYGADIVAVEGTYGAREREDATDGLTVLKEAVDWIVERHGVLLIPAFSIERSQELLYLFNTLFNKHQLPKIPIYLDSPLAIEALEVFERHQELYKKEVQQVRRVDDDIFSFRGLALAATVEDSRAINEEAPPKIIIAGSGMMAGGRIHHHLKRYLGWPNTYLLVVGYQAPGTLGSEILQGRDPVRIMDANIPVRAKIVKADVFSGHADNSELIDWLTGIRYSKKPKIFIIHAEADKAVLFAENIKHALPEATVEAPALGAVVEV
jgi:metallo-beta-lactamase family protein